MAVAAAAAVLASGMVDGVVALWFASFVVAVVVGVFVSFVRCIPSHPSRVVPFLKGVGLVVSRGRRTMIEGSRSHPFWDCRDFSVLCCHPRSKPRGHWIGGLRRGRL